MTLPTAPLHWSRFVLLCFCAAMSFAFFMAYPQTVRAQTPDPSEPTHDDILFLARAGVNRDWKSFIMNADGSDKRRLIDEFNFPRSHFSEYAAVFSPDRTQIILAVFKLAMTSPRIEPRLYRVNADGTDLTLLWRSSEVEVLVGPLPLWSPNGDQILFAVSTNTGSVVNTGSDIYVINSDGSGEKALVSKEGQYNSNPVWSPDGTQILFTSSNRGEDDYGLFMINADGTDLHEVLGGSARFAWSPTGEKIAVTLMDDRNLYLVNPDGSGLEQITNMGPVSDPVWSPDGAYIAFVSTQDSQQTLYRINADGRELTELSTIDEMEFACLHWMPGGEQLTVMIFVNGYSIDSRESNIYTIPADGSRGITALTDDSETEALSHCFSLFG